MEKTTSGLQISCFQLKIIGCALMAIDHIGYLLFPDIIALRMIGRLAFPIFAYLIANGYRHSHNLYKYLLMLLIFAAAFQLPYMKIMDTNTLNILFTLALGLITIYVFDMYQGNGSYLLVVLFALAAEFLNMDYGVYGILMIFTSHLLFNKYRKLLIAWALISLPYITEGILSFYQNGVWCTAVIQVLALAAIPIIMLYKGEKGRSFRLGFYLFYPIHIVILFLFKIFCF